MENILKENAKVSVFLTMVFCMEMESLRVFVFTRGAFLNSKNTFKDYFISAKAILLDIGMTAEEMEEAVCNTIRKNKLSDGYVRLLVTRGVGSLGLSPFVCDNRQS